MLGNPRGDGGADVPAPWAPRMARWVTLAVLGGYALTTVLNVLDRRPGPARLAGLALCLAAVLVLQFAHSTRQPRAWPARVRALTLSAQALATYLPLAWIGLPWGAMAGFLAGSVLLAVPGRIRWPLYGAVTAGIVPTVVADVGPGGAVYGIGVTLLTGHIVFGVSSLSDLVAELRRARRALADMAVVQERLRVARDMHDLLGYSLSAIMLKSELAYRLVTPDPGRARAEVAEVLDVAGKALADVRLVATGYRGMSLTAEVRSALSVLSAARITAEADLNCGALPREVDAVLAVVLREAVTNALRHSKAQRCTITASREGETVTLRIGNDGVDGGRRGPAEGGGSGLDNLTARLRRIGGALTAETTDDGWFRITARAPIEPHGDAHADDAPRERDQAAQHWAPRMARGTLVVALAGYAFITVVNAADVAGSGGAMLAFLGCFAVVVALQAFHSLRRPRTWPVRVRTLTLGLQAGATYAPLLWLDRPWGAMAGFLAGSLLLATSGRPRWALYAASAAVGPAVAAIAGASPSYGVYLAVSSLMTGLVVYGVTTLYLLVAELHEARGALARLAVARERLFVERELQQVLGSSLSAITLKCELIHRLLPHAPEAACEELTTVLDVSRRALADVRRVARGYRGHPEEYGADKTQWPLPDTSPPDKYPFVDFPSEGREVAGGE